MKSLAFPDMFANTKTKVITDDKKATISNMKLIIASGLNTLYGDPGYGNSLQDVLFETNSVVLKDIVKTTIYTCLNHYIPQLIFNVDDISVKQTKTTIQIGIKAYNTLTKDLDVYTIDLSNEGDDTTQVVV